MKQMKVQLQHYYIHDLNDDPSEYKKNMFSSHTGARSTYC